MPNRLSTGGLGVSMSIMGLYSQYLKLQDDLESISSSISLINDSLIKQHYKAFRWIDRWTQAIPRKSSYDYCEKQTFELLLTTSRKFKQLDDTLRYLRTQYTLLRVRSNLVPNKPMKAEEENDDDHANTVGPVQLAELSTWIENIAVAVSTLKEEWKLVKEVYEYLFGEDSEFSSMFDEEYDESVIPFPDPDDSVHEYVKSTSSP
ncbi:hypothetical protein DFH27DRAFT_615010 [Peziza echinospora]|nr:hypothetical protein DFH27DRAFT_615010 [Peziza echinospora]